MQQLQFSLVHGKAACGSEARSLGQPLEHTLPARAPPPGGAQRPDSREAGRPPLLPLLPPSSMGPSSHAMQLCAEERGRGPPCHGPADGAGARLPAEAPFQGGRRSGFSGGVVGALLTQISNTLGRSEAQRTASAPPLGPHGGRRSGGHCSGGGALDSNVSAVGVLERCPQPYVAGPPTRQASLGSSRLSGGRSGGSDGAGSTAVPMVLEACGVSAKSKRYRLVCCAVRLRAMACCMLGLFQTRIHGARIRCSCAYSLRWQHGCSPSTVLAAQSCRRTAAQGSRVPRRHANTALLRKPAASPSPSPHARPHPHAPTPTQRTLYTSSSIAGGSPGSSASTP